MSPGADEDAGAGADAAARASLSSFNTRTARPPPSIYQSVPERLRALADDEESPEICWQPGGDGIIVTDRAKVQTYWKSFTRSMYAWGFRKGSSPQTKEITSTRVRKKHEDYWYHEKHLFTKDDLQLQHTMSDYRIHMKTKRFTHLTERRRKRETKGALSKYNSFQTDSLETTGRTHDTSSSDQRQSPAQSLPRSEEHVAQFDSFPTSLKTLNQATGVDAFESQSDIIEQPQRFVERGNPLHFGDDKESIDARKELATVAKDHAGSHGCKRQRTCAAKEDEVDEKLGSLCFEECKEKLSVDVGLGNSVGSPLVEDVDDENDALRFFMDEVSREGEEVDSVTELLAVANCGHQQLVVGDHEPPDGHAAMRFWKVVESFLRDHQDLLQDPHQDGHTNRLHGSSFNQHLIGMTNAVEDLEYLWRISRFATSRRPTCAGGDGRNESTFDFHAFVWQGFDSNVQLQEAAPNNSAMSEQIYWIKKKLQDLLLSHSTEEVTMAAAVESLSNQLEGLQRISTGRRKQPQQEHLQDRGDDDDNNGGNLDKDNDKQYEARDASCGRDEWSNFDGNGSDANGRGSGDGDDDDIYDIHLADYGDGVNTMGKTGRNPSADSLLQSSSASRGKVRMKELATVEVLAVVAVGKTLTVSQLPDVGGSSNDLSGKEYCAATDSSSDEDDDDEHNDNDDDDFYRCYDNDDDNIEDDNNDNKDSSVRLEREDKNEEDAVPVAIAALTLRDQSTPSKVPDHLYSVAHDNCSGRESEKYNCHGIDNAVHRSKDDHDYANNTNHAFRAQREGERRITLRQPPQLEHRDTDLSSQPDARGKDRYYCKSFPFSPWSRLKKYVRGKVWRTGPRQQSDDDDSASVVTAATKSTTSTLADQTSSKDMLEIGCWNATFLPSLPTSRSHFAAVLLREEGKVAFRKNILSRIHIPGHTVGLGWHQQCPYLEIVVQQWS